MPPLENNHEILSIIDPNSQPWTEEHLKRIREEDNYREVMVLFENIHHPILDYSKDSVEQAIHQLLHPEENRRNIKKVNIEKLRKPNGKDSSDIATSQELSYEELIVRVRKLENPFKPPIDSILFAIQDPLSHKLPSIEINFSLDYVPYRVSFIELELRSLYLMTDPQNMVNASKYVTDIRDETPDFYKYNPPYYEIMKISYYDQSGRKRTIYFEWVNTNEGIKTELYIDNRPIDRLNSKLKYELTDVMNRLFVALDNRLQKNKEI